MNDNKDYVKIEINIAGELIMLSVPFDKQESVRDCENAINKLYKEWRLQFPRKTASELLAMVAYQYASYYHELSDRFDALNNKIGDINSELSRLLSIPSEISNESAPKNPDSY